MESSPKERRRVRRAGPPRSALDDWPGPTPPAVPAVTAIVPVLNEIRYIHNLIEDLVRQDYPGLIELLIYDGGSNDGTRDALKELRSRDPRIQVIENPRRVQAAAMNLGVVRARGEIVLRLDAHARYAPDVVSRSVEALLATGAAGVGPIMAPQIAESMIARAITDVHKSAFAMGGARFRRPGARGWVDTIWNGCYWKYIVEQAGPVREDLYRCEDNEFNYRIRALGYGLYLSPDIRAVYQTRPTLRKLWGQQVQNGIGAMYMVRNRRAFRLRHVVPLGFVGTLLLLIALLPFLELARVALMTVLAAYAVFLGLACLDSFRRDPGWHVALLPIVLTVLHVAYGLGSLYGLFAFGVGRR